MSILQHQSFRDHIHEIAKGVKNKRKGVWDKDESPSFNLIDFDSIDTPNGSVIYPKIYRRCVDYVTDLSKGNFTGDLIEWLHYKGDKEDDETLLDERFKSQLSQVLEIHNSRMTMTADINDLTFVER